MGVVNCLVACPVREVLLCYIPEELILACWCICSKCQVLFHTCARRIGVDERCIVTTLHKCLHLPLRECGAFYVAG